MRFLATVFLLAAATGGAQASSILVIGDGDALGSHSVLRLGSPKASGSLTSASVLRLQSLTPEPIVETAAETDDAEEMPADAPMPMVIRAGISGDAFTRTASGAPAVAPVTETQPAETSAPRSAPQQQATGDGGTPIVSPTPANAETTVQ